MAEAGRAAAATAAIAAAAAVAAAAAAATEAAAAAAEAEAARGAAAARGLRALPSGRFLSNPARGLGMQQGGGEMKGEIKEKKENEKNISRGGISQLCKLRGRESCIVNRTLSFLSYVLE